MHDPAAATDDMLLAAASRGDEAAFARLVQRHGNRARPGDAGDTPAD